MRQIMVVLLIAMSLCAWGVDALLPASPFHDFLRGFTVSPDTFDSEHETNYVLLQESAHEALVLRLHLIRNAARTIDIQTFIWADDECARLVQYELEQAARRGVKIRVLVDYMGLSPAFNPTPEEGAEPIDVKVYRPPLTLAKSILPHHILDALMPRGANQRMHLKTIVVDGIVGITGGRNFDNHYFGRSTSYNFKDRDAVLIGPAVERMAACFEDYWRFKKSVRRNKMLPISSLVPSGAEGPLTADDVQLTTLFADVDAQANDPDYVTRAFIEPMRRAADVKFVYDKPGKKTRLPYINPLGGGAVTELLSEEFRAAETSIVVQSPYVVVNRRSRHIFHKALKRHPDLRVLVSTNSFGAADHLITYAANFRLRPQVIGRLGFEVHEYMPHPDDLDAQLPNYDTLRERADALGASRAPFLSIHAKSYVMDGATAFVGSYNLDPRSFYYNSECGVLIRDRAIAHDAARHGTAQQLGYRETPDTLGRSEPVPGGVILHCTGRHLAAPQYEQLRTAAGRGTLPRRRPRFLHAIQRHRQFPRRRRAGLRADSHPLLQNDREGGHAAALVRL